MFDKVYVFRPLRLQLRLIKRIKSLLLTLLLLHPLSTGLVRWVRVLIMRSSMLSSLLRANVTEFNLLLFKLETLKIIDLCLVVNLEISALNSAITAKIMVI
jgi:hypothetical protein